MTDLLRQVGLQMPRGGILGLAGTIASRMRLSRRLFTEIPSESRSEPTPRDQNRLEVVYVAVTGLGLTDSAAAGALQAEHLRLAVASGDAERMARAFGMELVYRSASGYEEKGLRQARTALEGLMPRLSSRETRAFVHTALGYSAFLRGDFLDARVGLETGSDLFERMGTASWAH